MPPAPPGARANPIALTWRLFGSSFAVTVIIAGYRGPMKKPRNEMATAETTNCGTSQNKSCSATQQAI